MKKVLVNVYRNASFSNQFSDLLTDNVSFTWLFESNNVKEIVSYCKENNLDVSEQLMLNKRILWGKKKYYAEPVCKREGNQMFGGNFIYSSDANFSEMIESSYPLPVHDRFENWN